MPTCPRCKSTNNRKAGVEILVSGDKQRIKCKDCGHTFTPYYITKRGR